MRDRDVEAVLGRADDVSLEPVRAALRMGGDHDLVGAEGAERVLDRLERITVPNRAFRLNAVQPELREACIEPLSGPQREHRPRPTPSAVPVS